MMDDTIQYDTIPYSYHSIPTTRYHKILYTADQCTKILGGGASKKCPK